MNVVRKLRLGYFGLSTAALFLAAFSAVFLNFFVSREGEVLDAALMAFKHADRASEGSLEVIAIAHRLDTIHDPNEIKDTLSELSEKQAALSGIYADFFERHPAADLPVGADLSALPQLAGEISDIFRTKIRKSDEMSTAVAAIESDVRVFLRAVRGHSPTARGSMLAANEVLAGLGLLRTAASREQLITAEHVLKQGMQNLFHQAHITRNATDDPTLRAMITKACTAIYTSWTNASLVAKKHAELEIAARATQLSAELVSVVTGLRSTATALVDAEIAGANQRLDRFKRARNLAIWVLMGWAALVLLGGLILIYFVVEKQVSRRLKRVEATATRIISGDLSEHDVLRGDDEFALLSRLTDNMRRILIRQKDLEADLLVATDRAVSSAKTKAEFLAMMGHELRTPLNAIMGLLELVAKADIPEKPKRQAMIASRASDELHDLLNEILDASQIDAGAITVNSGPVETQALAADFLGMVEGALARHSRNNVVALSQISADFPQNFVSDAHRIKQVIRNLVDNAVRFTEHGSIMICFSKEATLGGDVLKICIEDTGIGIPAADSKAIFDRFQQTEGGVAPQTGGSGLGLSISRDIAELLGGSLNFESRPQGGSRFCLSIPG